MALDNNYIRRNAYVSSRSRQRKRRQRVRIFIGILIVFAVLAAIIAGIYFIKQKEKTSDLPSTPEAMTELTKPKPAISIPSPEMETVRLC